eukprot:1147354-Pelagomonas_calceolata.AAC.5
MLAHVPGDYCTPKIGSSNKGRTVQGRPKSSHSAKGRSLLPAIALTRVSQMCHLQRIGVWNSEKGAPNNSAAKHLLLGDGIRVGSSHHPGGSLNVQHTTITSVLSTSCKQSQSQ